MLAIPGLGGADSRIPVALISPDFLGDLQANERCYLKKVRWRVGKEWHPRLVTFGLNTCTHQWAQTRIYSHGWQCHSSDVWCPSWLSSAELSSALTVRLYLRPETKHHLTRALSSAWSSMPPGLLSPLPQNIPKASPWPSGKPPYHLLPVRSLCTVWGLDPSAAGAGTRLGLLCGWAHRHSDGWRQTKEKEREEIKQW